MIVNYLQINIQASTKVEILVSLVEFMTENEIIRFLIKKFVVCNSN